MERAIELLRKAGKSVHAISRELGISADEVHAVLDGINMPARRTGEPTEGEKEACKKRRAVEAHRERQEGGDIDPIAELGNN